MGVPETDTRNSGKKIRHRTPSAVTACASEAVTAAPWRVCAQTSWWRTFDADPSSPTGSPPIAVVTLSSGTRIEVWSQGALDTVLRGHAWGFVNPGLLQHCWAGLLQLLAQACSLQAWRLGGPDTQRGLPPPKPTLSTSWGRCCRASASCGPRSSGRGRPARPKHSLFQLYPRPPRSPRCLRPWPPHRVRPHRPLPSGSSPESHGTPVLASSATARAHSAPLRNVSHCLRRRIISIWPAVSATCPCSKGTAIRDCASWRRLASS